MAGIYLAPPPMRLLEGYEPTSLIDDSWEVREQQWTVFRSQGREAIRLCAEIHTPALARLRRAIAAFQTAFREER